MRDIDAVILAAGCASRFNDLRGEDDKIVKPLLPVGGIPLIVRAIMNVQEVGIERVVIVVGYRGEELAAALRQDRRITAELVFMENDEWRKANGVSLLKAHPAVRGAFVLLMSDHVFDREILEGLLGRDPGEGVILCVDRKLARIFDMDDATKVQAYGERILAIGKTLADFNAVDCGIFLCSQAVFAALEQAMHGGDVSLSEGMQVLAARGRFLCHDIGPYRFFDVDNEAMLADCESHLSSTLITASGR